MRTERHSRRRGGLSGRRKRRRRQQQPAAWSGCKVFAAILLPLSSSCSVLDMLLLRTSSMTLVRCSSSSPPPAPLPPTLLSPFRLIHAPRHFSSLQLCEQRGRCMNDCSSSRHRRTETIRLRPTRYSSSATQPTQQHVTCT